MNMTERYRAEVYRLGFMAYGWRVYHTDATSRLPLAFGGAVTKRGALRGAARWTRTREPVLTMELP